MSVLLFFLIVALIAGALFATLHSWRRPRVPDHVPLEWTRAWQEQRTPR